MQHERQEQIILKVLEEDGDSQASSNALIDSAGFCESELEPYEHSNSNDASSASETYMEQQQRS